MVNILGMVHKQEAFPSLIIKLGDTQQNQQFGVFTHQCQLGHQPKLSRFIAVHSLDLFMWEVKNDQTRWMLRLIRDFDGHKHQIVCGFSFKL